MEEIVAVDAGALEEEVATEEEAASDAEETAVAEGAAVEKEAIADAEEEGAAEREEAAADDLGGSSGREEIQRGRDKERRFSEEIQRA